MAAITSRAPPTDPSEAQGLRSACGASRAGPSSRQSTAGPKPAESGTECCHWQCAAPFGWSKRRKLAGAAEAFARRHAGKLGNFAHVQRTRPTVACLTHGRGEQAECRGRSPLRCSKEDVKRAFRRLALVFHPDKNKGQNEEEATKRFQAIATAKDLLLGTCLSGTARPGPPVAKKPSVVVHWVCGACQMRHLGSLGSRIGSRDGNRWRKLRL
eukprot:g24134.t1